MLFARAAWAQKELLTFNEENKYMYYQVVPQAGIPADSLHDRAIYFLKTAYPKIKVKTNDTSGIKGSGEFLVVSGITLVKHVDGELYYTVTIECKDQKYRYWLTDFVFIPHKTDRYGNSVPVQGVEIPLENGAAKLDKKQFDSYLGQIGALSKQFGDKLKVYMQNKAAAPAKDAKKKVTSTKDW